MATIKVKYLLRKAGHLYYSRRIPDDLKKHYSGKSLIRVNLGTQDIAKATRLIAEHASRDDILWKHIRNGLPLTTAETREAAKAFLEAQGGYIGIINCKDPVEREALRLSKRDPKERGVLLSEALERYLAEHKKGQDIRFARDAKRAIGIVESTVGDLPLGSYTREHARAVRDFLVPGHSTATVRRRLDSISAVFNLGRREFDLQSAANPFEKMPIQGEGLDAQKRLPFSHDELATISKACLHEDDDIRWIIALQLGTGARLGEIVGLRCEDVHLDHEIPHINIRPHEKLGRSLKTPGSERLVPLLGTSLWAAKQAMQEGRGWLFPRYAADNDIKATHCSGTVNKWISESLGIKKTSHSFRHSMKDLLRDVGCPDDIQRQLLGHGSKSVSDSYGQGYRLPILREWLEKALTCA